MKLNELIRELRRRLDWSQQKLAVGVNVAVRTVSVYETGGTAGSPEVIGRFMEIADRHGFRDLSAGFRAYTSFPEHGTVTLRHVESLRQSCALAQQQLAEVMEGIRHLRKALETSEAFKKLLEADPRMKEALEAVGRLGAPQPKQGSEAFRDLEPLQLSKALEAEAVGRLVARQPKQASEAFRDLEPLQLNKALAEAVGRLGARHPKQGSEAFRDLEPLQLNKALEALGRLEADLQLKKLQSKVREIQKTLNEIGKPWGF